MLLIYICEDDILNLKLYEKYINKSILFKEYNTKLEYSTGNPFELIKYISEKKENNMGLYFLNMNFNCKAMNGLRLADQIRKMDPRGFIVFITAHSEMSFISLQFGTEALDYILKDNTEEIQLRIDQDIKRAYERYIWFASKQSCSLSLKSGNRKIILNTKDILYVDSSAAPHKLEIHTNNEVLSVYGSLGEMLKKFPDNFYRCHKSYIINFTYIKEINNTLKEIKLVNGEVCPVSLQYLKRIKELKNVADLTV